MRTLILIFLVAVPVLSLNFTAFGYQQNQLQLTLGLGGILMGVSALLIAAGALVLFAKFARVLDAIEKKFKED